MTAILFTIAAAMLVWLAIVAPSVIRSHRQWKAWAAFLAALPGLEEQMRQLTEQMARVGLAATQTAVSAKALAQAFVTPDSKGTL